MNNNIIDLHEYKKAIIMSKDIVKMLRICDYALRGLSEFTNKYKIARELALLIQDVQRILEIHKAKADDIIKTRGITRE